MSGGSWKYGRNVPMRVRQADLGEKNVPIDYDW